MIVYCSITGNVRNFVSNLLELDESIETLELKNGKEIVSDEYIIITGTTGLGEIPPVLVEFLKDDTNARNCLGVIGSGNKNWGNNFCKGAYKVSDIVAKPILHTFELRGEEKDLHKVLQIIKETYN